jgi:hypothetical protein
MVSFHSFGTPSMVWRRNGEICGIGKELTLLTGWTLPDLIEREDNYLHSLFDSESLTQYWEDYSQMALNPFLPSRPRQCSLSKVPNERMECILYINIHRDLFNIPILIVGQFMPKPQ